MGLWVLNLSISLVMIVRMRIFYLIFIIKSEVLISCHCLWLGLETMVCAVCLLMFLLEFVSSNMSQHDLCVIFASLDFYHTFKTTQVMTFGTYQTQTAIYIICTLIQLAAIVVYAKLVTQRVEQVENISEDLIVSLTSLRFWWFNFFLLLTLMLQTNGQIMC